MYALYRAGDTHEVDGVKCELARVVLGDLDIYRSEGWVDNIEDVYPEKKEKAKKEKAKKEKAE